MMCISFNKFNIILLNYNKNNFFFPIIIKNSFIIAHGFKELFMNTPELFNTICLTIQKVCPLKILSFYRIWCNLSTTGLSTSRDTPDQHQTEHNQYRFHINLQIKIPLTTSNREGNILSFHISVNQFSIKGEKIIPLEILIAHRDYLRLVVRFQPT